MKKILIIDDEKVLGMLIKEFLESQAFEVFFSPSGIKGLDLFKKNSPDLVILDVNLPGLNGVTICKRIRAIELTVPICMLSANTDTEIIVEALNEGADDYLTKPFRNQELLARIKALFRRYRIGAPIEEGEELRLDDLTINLKLFEVTRDKKKITLTNKEFLLLEYLCKNRGKIITRSELLSNVWNLPFDTQTNVVDVHISWLRRKIQVSPKSKKIIHTISGKGYMIEIL